MSKKLNALVDNPLFPISLVLLHGGLYHLFGARIPFAGGFGYFDGTLYGGWARDFYHLVFEIGVGPYYIQRILPSALVHYTFRLLAIPLTDGNIVEGFRALNILCLCGVSYFWFAICDGQKWGRATKWFGLVALLVNYEVQQFGYYYCVLTDICAELSAVMMLYFYLGARPLGLLLTTIAGGFVFPTQAYLGAALFFFLPRPGKHVAVPESLRRAIPVIGGLLLLAALGGHRAALSVILQDHPTARIIGLLLALGGVVAGVVCLASPRGFPSKPLAASAQGWWWYAATAVGYLAFSVFRKSLSVPGFQVGTGRLTEAVIQGLSALPLGPILSLMAFFGPLILVMGYLWRPMCERLAPYGAGLWSVIALGIPVAIFPESRGWVGVYPFYVFVACAALPTKRFTQIDFALFFLVSLMLSRFGHFFAGPLEHSWWLDSYRGKLCFALATFGWVWFRLGTDDLRAGQRKPSLGKKHSGV